MISQKLHRVAILAFSIALCLTVFADHAQGATVLIDLGNSSNPTTGQSQTWNNIINATGPASHPLVDTLNNPTGISLNINGSLSILPENVTPSGAPYPDSATKDAFFNGSARTFTFTGLDPSLTYNITVYGYINRPDSRETRVQIGSTTLSYEPGMVNSNNHSGGSVTFTNISPVNGEIAMQFTTPTGNYIIGVIELTAVPEPSRALFLLFAGFFVLSRRRKHCLC